MSIQTANAQLTGDDLAAVGARPGLAARCRHALVVWTGADPETLVSGLDAVKVLLIRCIGAVIACALQVALARLLGAVEYGTFALVWIWVVMLGQISPLGFSTVICRFAPFYSARGETALLRGFLSTSSVVVFALAMTVATLGITGLWTLGSGLSEAERWAFTAGLCIVPVIAMQDVVENIARAFNWPVLAIAPGYIVRPVLTLIGLVTVALAMPEIDALAAVSVTLVATLIGAAGSAAVLLGRVRRVVRPGARIRRLREWARSALPLMFVDGTHLIFTNADILILSFYVEPEAIAVYYAAARILQLVAFGQYATTAATAQRFSSLAATGEMTSLRKLAQHATWFNVVVSTAAAVVVFWAAPLLLGMFGAGFESGATVLTILVAGLILQAAAGPGEDILNMLGHQRACAATFVVSLVLNIVLNLALIPQFGLIGAALATTISVGARSFALSWMVRSRLGMNIVLGIPLGLRTEAAT